MKRIGFLFTCSTALAAGAAVLFVNNVVAIVHWWQAFLASGGASGDLIAHATGLWPWLDWSVVDYSAVTTLIPLVGFLAMSVSLGRLLRGGRARTDDFPFFPGSDQLMIALGLFGTLWGIIVIGYFKLDTVTMADLMQCLHTALFSTLMAVVWVFMIDHPLVRPLLTRVLRSAGRAEPEEGDLAAAVDRLVARLNAATDAFERREKAFEEAFEKRLADAETRAEAAEKRLRAVSEALRA